MIELTGWHRQMPPGLHAEMNVPQIPTGALIRIMGYVGHLSLLLSPPYLSLACSAPPALPPRPERPNPKKPPEGRVTRRATPQIWATATRESCTRRGPDSARSGRDRDRSGGSPDAGQAEEALGIHRGIAQPHRRGEGGTAPEDGPDGMVGRGAAPFGGEKTNPV